MVDADVRFTVVGGLACLLRGAAVATLDLDIWIPHDEQNPQRLLDAIRPFQPRLVSVPIPIDLSLDAKHLRGHRELKTDTNEGQAHVRYELSTLKRYDGADAVASVVLTGAGPVAVLEPDALIREERAVGRPKDLPAAEMMEDLKRRGDALSSRRFVRYAMV
jgi:hypothetical protein